MLNAIRLIVGLGNPGQQYERTRHNVGAWLVDRFTSQANIPWRAEKKFFGLIARNDTQIDSPYLLKPLTFMNESGRSVAAVVNFYKIPPPAVLVVHDELDFPAGVIRFKQGGGHGGHNGLRSIGECLNSNDYCRLRIGIGHPGHRDQVTPYVLGCPSKDDEKKILQAIDQGIQIIPYLIAGDYQKAFQYLHTSA